MAQRSTKGASKQRRDAINERVGQIRQLLPVSEAARSRLSQLQVMALARSYIAKSNVFVTHAGSEVMEERTTTWTDHFDFLQAVPGFLMIFGLDGKILYISDSVCDYLGNSAVDVVTQTETLFELVDERDHAMVRDALNDAAFGTASSSASSSSAAAATEADGETKAIVSFVCRMNTAARNVRYTMSPIRTGFERSRMMQVRGCRLRSDDLSPLLGYQVPASVGLGEASQWRASADCPAFAVVCTPSLSAADVLSTSLLDGGAVAWDTTVFRSQHLMDMKFTNVDEIGQCHLGYDAAGIYGKSWYEMIHVDDLELAQRKHLELMQCGPGELNSWRSLCLRLQTGRGDFIWLHVVMRVCDVIADDVKTRRVVCINQLISDDEARALNTSMASAVADQTLLGDFMPTIFDGLFDSPPSQSHHFDLASGVGYSGAGKRRLAPGWSESGGSAAKMGRWKDEAALMSMPSPPLSYVGGTQDLDLSAASLQQTSTYGQVMMTSAAPSLSFPSSSTLAGFLDTDDAAEPTYHIPDSFLTPNGSPVQQPVVVLDQHHQEVGNHATLPYLQHDELSFFEPPHLSATTVKSEGIPMVAENIQFANKSAGTFQMDSKYAKNAAVRNGNLPELDLTTVMSFFDGVESRSEPTKTVAAPAVAVPAGNHRHHHHQQQQRYQQAEMWAEQDVKSAVTQSTIDDEVLHSLFSTAHSFMQSLNEATAVTKPMDAGWQQQQQLLYSH